MVLSDECHIRLVVFLYTHYRIASGQYGGTCPVHQMKPVSGVLTVFHGRNGVAYQESPASLCKRYFTAVYVHSEMFGAVLLELPECLQVRKETIPSYIVVLGWYRPTLEQTLRMSEGAIFHVLKGGLFLEDELNVNSDDND